MATQNVVEAVAELGSKCYREREALMCQIEGLKFDALGEPRTRYVRVTLNRSHCVMHPSEGDCYVQDARDACDHDWEFQDESFDHEYGCEQVHFWRCAHCGETKDMEAGDYGYDDDY